VPRTLGGVKMPSERAAAILSRHQARSFSVAPHASSARRPSGPSEMPDEGCVGHASSPGTSLGGAGRSSTGTSGAPVVRSRTNTRPILVVTAIAGVPSRQAKSVGCDATS
jgi:hypothetical protein